MAQPVGCFGRLGFKSKGVDSLVGYWEIAGCLTEEEGARFRTAIRPRPSQLEAVFRTQGRGRTCRVR